ncbi:MAG: hypothetical protein JW724_02140 [Candidatus Altiarchaeota archaeon]|nr:hypothetical protein [Candidatus Altiarchaeota archaeon]
MKVDIVTKKKGVLEVECEDKNLPIALLNVLVKDKVDAYTYEPHPLLPAYRLHIEADDSSNELKKALKTVEADWKSFGDELQKKLSPGKKKTKKK